MAQTSVKKLFGRKTGEQRKQSGQDLVESHNEDFVQLMRDVAVQRCKTHGTVHSDYLRKYAEENGLRPKHPNAWGAIFRGSQWRKVRMMKSAFKTNNARMVTIWRLASGDEDELDGMSKDELIREVRSLRRLVRKMKGH